MKKPDLEKAKGKKIAGHSWTSARNGQGGAALNKREQALEQKRELLEKRRKTKS